MSSYDGDGLANAAPGIARSRTGVCSQHTMPDVMHGYKQDFETEAMV
ncbi:MAG: hypothetical protein AVDCRST_MAG93-8028 [uncultured Chloroflexia bacterium]|uniref:Uncharacterized protein n=1 Tax=uncultured Chloroflexia bacterium TaxID=1672391 RepID=A0A6J4MRE2_9CHLR|nr:MAG: hypothetical protein AVDCRST_MAG93-8028 [uncultured Chloroflexia bacterium]